MTQRRGAETTATRALTLERLAGCGLCFLVAVILQGFFYRFVRSRGVVITGDEPAYIMQAQALSHFTVHVLSTITSDLRTGVFAGTYPPHATVSQVERYVGPAGTVSPFEPGLSILLVPFVAVVGPVTGAVMAMISFSTAGSIWIHQRISRLAGLSPLGRALLAVAMASVAILVAANQVYPDLVAGIVVAIALVEIATTERDGAVSTTSAILGVSAVAVLPWIQPKNLIPAAIVLVVFVVVAYRRAAKTAALVAVLVFAVSIASFLVYNQHFYSHVLGLPEPGPRLGWPAIEYTLGLLFDRGQGLFVQVPLCLVGLGCLVVMRWRSLRGTIVATLGSFLAILVLNGSYVGNPYGGASLAGRFMWTLIPISLPWLAFGLARIGDRRVLLSALGVVLVLWVVQAVDVLGGHHVYYNAFGTAGPWPSWWPGVGRLLPVFSSSTHHLGSPAWGLPLELVVDAVVLLAAAAAFGWRPSWGPWPGGTGRGDPGSRTGTADASVLVAGRSGETPGAPGGGGVELPPVPPDA
jgi:hypothetical protein